MGSLTMPSETQDMEYVSHATGVLTLSMITPGVVTLSRGAGSEDLRRWTREFLMC